MIYRFVVFGLHVGAIFFFHLTVRGRKNLYKVGGAIMAVNHSSFMEPIFAGVACSRPLYYLTRKSLHENKFFGNWLMDVHGIPLNRDAPDSRAWKRVFSLLKRGRMIMMFPEGTRSPDGRLQPAKPGIGLIALRARVPIVPVFVKGGYRILPRHRKFPRLAKAGVFIGEPIYPDRWLNNKRPEKSDCQELADLVMARIKELGRKER